MSKIKNPLILLRNKDIKQSLVRICQENDIIFLGIFGSFVRGEQNKKSDIDIAIEYAHTENKSLFDLVELEGKLKSFFGRKIDLGILSSISPYLVKDVKKQMKIIYEKR